MELDDALRAAGAVAWGVAPAQAVDDTAAQSFDHWLQCGFNAAMEYMQKYHDIRLDPRLLLEGAQSVISIAFPYPAPPEFPNLRWASYALGDDYHDVLRRRLQHVVTMIKEKYDAESRICVDSAPILEKYWAERTGVGFKGLNSQIIVPGIGSRIFLAEIVTTLSIDPDESSHENCSGCRRCINACPGGAISEDGTIDARKCLSYLTIECRDEQLPPDLNLCGQVYGCDICLNVCPHNHPATLYPDEFKPRQSILSLTKEDVDRMDQATFSTVFTRSPIKRTKLAGLKRNVKSL
ncbi:MAG: tRNA epoxyqueuosine(34) reductase QueG [Lachnoclostridium sp.]|nr:tRNA epoxyqueuosine(34) reductase QueG [Lachnoclostridium sp.]